MAAGWRSWGSRDTSTPPWGWWHPACPPPHRILSDSGCLRRRRWSRRSRDCSPIWHHKTIIIKSRMEMSEHVLCLLSQWGVHTEAGGGRGRMAWSACSRHWKTESIQKLGLYKLLLVDHEHVCGYTCVIVWWRSGVSPGQTGLHVALLEFRFRFDVFRVIMAILIHDHTAAPEVKALCRGELVPYTHTHKKHLN